MQAISKVLARGDIQARAVVCDGEPQNLALLKRLRNDYVVMEAQARESGAARLGQEACGSLIDMVNESRFKHRGQPELTESLRTAVVRSLGDGWVYSRSKSRGDVSPLLAAACGLHVAETELDLVSASGVFVY